MEPVLSIVIAAYNMEKYIEKCLNSITSASLINDIEIVVVNDGSSDNTDKIIRKVIQCNKTCNLKYIVKPNGGYFSTIKQGILNATGKYIKLLDADDWCNTSGLDEHIKYLKATDSDVVITNYLSAYQHKNIKIKNDFKKSYKNYSILINNKQNIKTLFQPEKFISSTSMHNLTTKSQLLKKYLKNISIDKNIYYTDNIILFLSLFLSNNISYNDTFVYIYLRDRGGDQTTFCEQTSEQLLKNVNYHIDVAKIIDSIKMINYHKTLCEFFIRNKLVIPPLYRCCIFIIKAKQKKIHQI